MMGGGEERKTCRFLAMKRDRAGDLPFAILVRDTFRQTLLQDKKKNVQIVPKVPGNNNKKKKMRTMRTLVRTAMDAKEFPKFIPMTVCDGGISIGACALPFGIRGPFKFILCGGAVSSRLW
jgi:hypothetical protein